MSNLTEQDNAKLLTQEECLISDINERLKRLEDLYFSKGQQNIEPIDTTEGEPIETEQRWKPNYNEDFWYLLTDLSVTSDKLDHTSAYYQVESLNCFKTEQKAQEAAEAIKQYLSTNKF